MTNPDEARHANWSGLASKPTRKVKNRRIFYLLGNLKPRGRTEVALHRGA